jgi:hypothetical protein
MNFTVNATDCALAGDWVWLPLTCVIGENCTMPLYNNVYYALQDYLIPAPRFLWRNNYNNGSYPHGNDASLNILSTNGDAYFLLFTTLGNGSFIPENSSINYLNISPQVTYRSSQLDCVFNINTTVNSSINVNVTWYNNSVNIPYYDYLWSNITSNINIVTNVSNGSIPNYVVRRGENWSCSIDVITQNSFNNFNSTYITILNSLPSIPQLLTYGNIINVTNGKPTLYFNDTDIDNDTVNTFIYISKNSNFSICYQEFANESPCQNPTNGNYFITNDSSSGILYINYTKPVTSNNAIWQVKHGDADVINPLYNISIPLQCFNQNILQFKITNSWSCNSQGASHLYCYNESDWQEIGNTSAGYVLGDNSGACTITGTTRTGLEMIDGDWSTYDTFMLTSPPGYRRWANGYPANHPSFVYEEAIWWNYSIFVYNTTSNNITVNDTLDYNTLYYSVLDAFDGYNWSSNSSVYNFTLFTNFYINAVNNINGSRILNFNATIDDNMFFSTTNGTINTNISMLSNITHNTQ